MGLSTRSFLRVLFMMTLLSLAIDLHARCLYFLKGSEQDSCGIQSPQDKLKEPDYQVDLPADLPDENTVQSIKIRYRCNYELSGSNVSCDLQRVIPQTAYVNSNNKGEICARARTYHKCPLDFIDP